MTNRYPRPAVIIGGTTTSLAAERDALCQERDGLKAENANLRDDLASAQSWRDAINAALTNWLSPIEDHEKPSDALQRLIRLEVMAALDPAVSKSAADLVAQARREALAEAARGMIEKHQSMIIRPNTPEAWRFAIWRTCERWPAKSQKS